MPPTVISEAKSKLTSETLAETQVPKGLRLKLEACCNHEKVANLLQLSAWNLDPKARNFSNITSSKAINIKVPF